METTHSESVAQSIQLVVVIDALDECDNMKDI